MKDFLKSIGGFLLGIVIFAGLIVVAILLFTLGLKIAFKIAPFVNWLAGVLFLIDVAFLFTALYRKARPVSGTVLFVSSYIFGISLWIYGLAVTLTLWGIVPLIIGLFMGGVGVVPIGMLAAVFHGQWGMFASLVGTTILTFGTRIAGMTLAESDTSGSSHSNHEDD